MGPVGFGVRGGLAFGVPAGVPRGEGPVPHKADASEGAAEDGLLFAGRVDPTLVRRPHATILPKETIMADGAIPPRPEVRGILAKSEL